MLQTQYRVYNASDTVLIVSHKPQSAECVRHRVLNASATLKSDKCFRHTRECVMLQTHHIVLNASETTQSA